MPPRNAPDVVVDSYGPMHPVFFRNYSPDVVDERTVDNLKAQRWPEERPDYLKSLRRDPVMGAGIASGLAAPRHFDVTIYVGRSRTPYTASTETLQCSSYFRSKIDRMREKCDPASSPNSPLVVDCEESVFQNMMSLLRYSSLEALPKLSDADLFRLKKEAEFYGVDWPEPSRKTAATAALPHPMTNTAAAVSTKPGSVVNHRHLPIAELPDFPAEIGDPAKLIMVTRVDDDARARCCCCTAGQMQSTWALSFHHRHAFCTGCSKPPTNVVPKFLAEMFMAAAVFYSSDSQLGTTASKWSVGCDSTCSLKFLHARPCCTCPCSKQSTVWVVSTYHSHAFCSQCGIHADGSTLVCVLLTVRYGGLHRSPSKGRRDHLTDIPISRETPKLSPAPASKQRIRSPDAQTPRIPRV